MESVPPEIISYIGGFLDVASASTLEHVLYKQPFKRMAGSDIVFRGFENFKLWSRYVDPNEICVAIAHYGTFEMFAWAYDRFPHNSTWCLLATLKNNNLKIAMTVVYEALEDEYEAGFFVSIAAQDSRICILDLLWRCHACFDWRAYTYAIEAKRFDVLDWLDTIGCEKDDGIIVFAAKSSDTKIVDWCHEMDIGWHPQAWEAAVDNRDIPMIEHLISLGYDTEYLGISIARSDDPALLKWAAVNLQ